MMRSTPPLSSNDNTNRHPSGVGEKPFARQYGTAILLLAAMGGCDKATHEADVHQLVQLGDGPCTVHVYSPPYGKSARPPDSVVVLWDGAEAFSGVLPVQDPRANGSPVWLLSIQADPGEHVLEVRHDGRNEKEHVILQEDGPRVLMVFGHDEEGREKLVEDLGYGVRFQ